MAGWKSQSGRSVEVGIHGERIEHFNSFNLVKPTLVEILIRLSNLCF